MLKTDDLKIANPESEDSKSAFMYLDSYVMTPYFIA